MRQAISASRNSYLRPMGVTPTIRGCIMKLGRSNAASAFPTSLVSFFYETLYPHFSVTRFFPLISNTLVRTCTDRKRRKQRQIPLAYYGRGRFLVPSPTLYRISMLSRTTDYSNRREGGGLLRSSHAFIPAFQIRHLSLARTCLRIV